MLGHEGHWSQAEARETSKVPIGPADSSAFASKMKLINGGNYCYANALVRCWLVNTRLFQDLDAVGGSAGAFKVLLSM